MNDLSNMTKCITACIIGKPNTGKSTLLNSIIQHKLSIVTPKIQTTRSIITGVITLNDTQIIIFDTPGIFEPKKKLEKAMVRCAWSSLNGADIVLVMLDSSKKLDRYTKQIIEHLAKVRSEFIFVINKIDIYNSQIIEIKNFIVNDYADKLVFEVSALKGNGVDKLKQYILDIAGAKPWLYDKDDITNLPMKFLASEIIREQLFLHLHEELPYNLTVQSELWKKNANGSITIHQVIIVTRNNHKIIILGKQGNQIREIGIKARLTMEKTFGNKIHLFLFVKVREDWQDSQEYYNYLGLDYKV